MTESGLFFFDSDIFVLFAGAGLIPELVSVAGFELAEARRLQPLPHMLRKGPLARKYPPGIRQKAEAWCAEIPTISQAPSPTLVDQLIEIQDVDAGEAILFALVAETNGALLTSGDKRACRALSNAEGLEAVRALLRGKVVSLEAALRLLLERIGYPTLTEALTMVREYNQTLRVILSQGELTSETAFRDGLDSYSRDLHSQAGDLLFVPPGQDP